MTTLTQNLKLLALAQLLVGAFFSLVLGFFGSLQLGASFAMGAGLMLLNVGLLAWVWWRILTQKTIAWTLIVIVIKYAVVLGTIYDLARREWFNPVGAGLGIASFIIAALVTALLLEQKEKEKE